MGRTVASHVSIVVLIAVVPALLALPAAACRPVGGELPGINCVPPAGVFVIGTCVFALVLGLSVDRLRRSGGGWSAILAAAGLAVGWFIALGLLYARPNGWSPRDLLRLRSWTVIGPLVAFGIGWLLRAVRRARR